MIHLQGHSESDFARAVQMLKWREGLQIENESIPESVVFEPEAQVAAVLAEASNALGSSGRVAAVAALRRAEWLLRQKREDLKQTGQHPDASLVAAHVVLDNHFAAHHRGKGQSNAALRYLLRATTAELGVLKSCYCENQLLWEQQCRLLSQTRANLAAALSEAGRHSEALDHALHAVRFATFALEGLKAAASVPDLDIQEDPVETAVDKALPPSVLDELREVLAVALHAVGTEGEFLELESTSTAARVAAKVVSRGLPAGHPLRSVIDFSAASDSPVSNETNAVANNTSVSSGADVDPPLMTPRRRKLLQDMLRRVRAGQVDRYELTAMQGFRRLEFVLLSRFGSMSSAFTVLDAAGRNTLSAQEWLQGISRLGVTKDIPLPLAKICYAYIQRYSSCPEAGITESDLRSFSKFQDQCWQWLPSHAHTFCTEVDRLLRTIRKAISQNFQSVRDAFETMDWNGDHMVSRNEFTAALSSLKVCKLIPEQDANFLFDALDQSRSGHLTFKELEFFFQKQAMDDTHRTEIPSNALQKLAPFKHRLLLRFACLNRAFAVMDINGDGMLNEHEFHGALRRWDVPPDEIKELWHAVDYTCVGVVGLQDFQRVLNRCECEPCGIASPLRLPSPLRKRCSEVKAQQPVDLNRWRFDLPSEKIDKLELAAEKEARLAVAELAELENDELTAEQLGKRRTSSDSSAKFSRNIFALPLASSSEGSDVRKMSEGSVATGSTATGSTRAGSSCSSSSSFSSAKARPAQRCSSPELKRDIEALQRTRRRQIRASDEDHNVEPLCGRIRPASASSASARLRRARSAPRPFTAPAAKSSVASAVVQLRDTVKLAQAAFKDVPMQEDKDVRKVPEAVHSSNRSELAMPSVASLQRSSDLKFTHPPSADELQKDPDLQIADLIGDIRTAMKQAQGCRPSAKMTGWTHKGYNSKASVHVAPPHGSKQVSGLDSLDGDLDKLCQSVLRGSSKESSAQGEAAKSSNLGNSKEFSAQGEAAKSSDLAAKSSDLDPQRGCHVPATDSVSEKPQNTIPAVLPAVSPGVSPATTPGTSRRVVSIVDTPYLSRLRATATVTATLTHLKAH